LGVEISGAENMKLKVAQAKQDNDENLIPLINIVFLLLIFFMLAGTFSRPEKFEVAAPKSMSQTSVEEQTLVVVLAADGRLAIGERQLDRPALKQLVSERLAAEKDLQVQLKADLGLAAGALIETMEVLRDTGVEKVMLLTVLDDR